MNMHDHVLIEIDVNWAKSEVKFFLKGPDSFVYEKIFRNFLSITIPRRNPWGESSSVNSYDIKPGDDGMMTNTIEMQSGDYIEIITSP